VQAWYTTQSVDLQGVTYIDDKISLHRGSYIPDPLNPAAPPIYLPDANTLQVTGNRLSDGVSSELYHVIVVADLAGIKGLTLGAVTDYTAMLSLAQTSSFAVCQPVASITNLMAHQCDAALKADTVTRDDLAYLQALYRINPRDSFTQQRNQIAYEMTKGQSSAGAP
jgi:hypothetical protein